VLAILLALWFVLHLRPLDRYLGFELPGFGPLPGLLMITLGGGLVLWCGGILAGVGVLESPGCRMFPREFVVTGPFRIIRNPMSFGTTALFAGLGLWLGSISILLFSAILSLIFHFAAVRIEEPGLERRFGSSYVAYKPMVGRWFPRLKTSKTEIRPADFESRYRILMARYALRGPLDQDAGLWQH
jgi:protein-S-isoprenylcysteine O-methyltransferase Ste14